MISPPHVLRDYHLRSPRANSCMGEQRTLSLCGSTSSERCRTAHTRSRPGCGGAFRGVSEGVFRLT
jgi:hypothetical protein